jgi:AcrR family transcriptional regulator
MSMRLSAAERRDQLLDVALELFARDGFHATSMNDIADAAGVTKPVLYQHFTSKRQLYRNLLAAEGQRLREAIAKATRDAAGPHEQVLQGTAAYFRWVAGHASAFNLLFGSGVRRDDEFAADVRHVERAIADAVTELIQADVPDAQRRVVAVSVIGMSEAVSRLIVHNGEQFDPDLLARQVAEFAWAGLRGMRRVDA